MTLMVGTGFGPLDPPAPVIAKSIALETPPPGAGLVTVTATLPLKARLAAGISAVNCVALTNVVTAADPLNVTAEAATKLVPFTVSVKPAPPAALLSGEILLIVGVV